MQKQIKLFLTDCDGVLTDGGMYYFNSGDEAKKFNTRDGMAFKMLKQSGVKVGIITGEENIIIINRAKKLNLDYVFMNSKDKLQIVDKLIKELKITYSEILYVGDDINDLSLLKKVGFSACPNDAEQIVKKSVSYISSKNGGFGVIRDIFNLYFGEENE